MNSLLNIPPHTRCRNCGECCGPVPATPEEIKAIRDYLKEFPEIARLVTQNTSRINCPFHDSNKKRCMIYPVRPLLCRLMGVVKGMKCTHGNSGELDGRTFLDFIKLSEVEYLTFQDWSV